MEGGDVFRRGSGVVMQNAVDGGRCGDIEGLETVVSRERVEGCGQSFGGKGQKIHVMVIMTTAIGLEVILFFASRCFCLSIGLQSCITALFVRPPVM